MRTFNEIIEVLWGIVLILVAIKALPLIGAFAALSIGLAGLKIGTLPIDRRVNGFTQN